MGLEKLIDYLIESNQTYVTDTLLDLSDYVSTIKRVHGPNHVELVTVDRLFHALKPELEQLFVQEEVLFPRLKEYERSPEEALFKSIQLAILELKASQEKIATFLKDIRNVTTDFSLPADSCTTYRITFEKLQAMEVDLLQHFQLETKLLFNKFEQ
jgi:regulator of cell morphogenesis and NO signaling